MKGKSAFFPFRILTDKESCGLFRMSHHLFDSTLHAHRLRAFNKHTISGRKEKFQLFPCLLCILKLKHLIVCKTRASRRIRNIPVGLGEPVFDRLEADLAKAMLSLPATKGFEIGSGFAGGRVDESCVAGARPLAPSNPSR